MKEQNRIIFYSKFENVAHISEEEKRKFLDSVIADWPRERLENLENLFEGKLNSKSREYRKAFNDINIVRKQYQKFIKTGLMPYERKRSLLYDRFRKYSSIEEEKMIEIVDTLFNLLSKSERDNIMNYINGLTSKKSPEGQKALSDIYNLKEQYKRYLKTGLMPKEKKRLYDRFIDIPGVSVEQKTKVIDYLLNIDQARKARVLEYINSGIKRNSKEGRLANKDLTYLQWQYKNGRNKPRIKPLYDRFPGENTEIKMLFIDILFLTLDEESQMVIKEYLNKEYNTKTINDTLALREIAKLIRKYNRIKLSEEKKSLLYSAMSLVEYKFKIKGFSKEEYNTYKDDLLKQVIRANSIFDIEIIIVIYINLAYQKLERMRQDEFQTKKYL